MKIGILTFPNSPSFGASLQMYGLYRTLEKMGYQVEILNYKNIFMSKKKHINGRSINIFKDIAIKLLDIPGQCKFKKFERNMKFFPKSTINDHNLDSLKLISEKYDFLICGSDQVWNPMITGEDLHYFLDFCKYTNKKISYAASFGVTNLTETYSKKVAAQLKLFSHISVREEEAVDIVKNLIGESCNLVIDPSMLLSLQEWRLNEKKIKKLPPHYIVRFIFNNDEKVEKTISNLSSFYNLPIVTIGGTIVSKLKGEDFTGPIGPEEWLYVIDHADYVVTDSFHGTVFSIIFEKNLIVSLASTTNSRLRNLLKVFDLEKCNVCNYDFKYKIDYESVKKILDENRKISLKYLYNAINCRTKNYEYFE